MKNKSELRLALVALFAASMLIYTGNANAQSSNFITHYSTFNSWLGILTVAALVGVMIDVGIYFAGALLKDAKLKERGFQELIQTIGSVVIAVIIVTLLTSSGGIISYLMTTAQSTVGNSITTICNNYLTNAKLDFLNEQNTYSPSNTICPMVENTLNSNGKASTTDNLDFALGATYIISANVTNEAVVNLNGLYTFEGMMGFLGSLTSKTVICEGEAGGTCALVPIEPRVVNFDLEYKPLAGYSSIKYVTVPVEVQADLVFYLAFMQDLLIVIFLYAWPYVLGAGIIMRSILYTRRAGGLMIAAAIAALFILPLVILMEYSALSGGLSSMSPIGANSLPVLTINETNYHTDNTITYTSNDLNFYVFPNTSYVAYYYGCYPINGNLLEEELKDSAALLIPFYGGALALEGIIYGGFPSGTFIPLFTDCTQTNLINTVFAFMNVYGVMSVVGFIMPLLNLIIFISAMLGLSQLLGGETTLPGLSWLI
ncbi:MAG: hypothetical protein ACP5TK_01690 [Candidatus Micrarchaeia archaeon]